MSNESRLMRSKEAVQGEDGLGSCPFCGSSALVLCTWREEIFGRRLGNLVANVICSSCGAEGPKQDSEWAEAEISRAADSAHSFADKQTAFQLWNRRRGR